MHAAFVCSEYPPAPHGGIGSLYRDLAEGVTSQGHKATVVGIYPGEKRVREEVLNGVRILRLPQTRLGSCKIRMLLDRIRLRRWLNRIHGETAFDLIEAPDYGGELLFGAPPAVPTFIRIEGANFFFDRELNRPGDPFEHWIEKLALRKATHLIAASRYAAAKTLEYAQLQRRSCEVIYNAVDTDRFAPAAASVEEGLVLFVNSINPKKGISEFVQAMNHLGRSYPHVRFVAIGASSQPACNGKSYVEQLLDQVHPEFRSRVTFTGRLDRHTGVAPYLRKAQICCFPSYMETFGIAPAEAMAAAKPTIYSQTGPGPEVIEDGVSGLLCNPRDSQDIAKKIAFLLERPEIARTMGQKARERVLSLFDLTGWIQKNLQLYHARLCQPEKHPSS